MPSVGPWNRVHSRDTVELAWSQSIEGGLIHGVSVWAGEYLYPPPVETHIPVGELTYEPNQPRDDCVQSVLCEGACQGMPYMVIHLLVISCRTKVSND